VSRRRRLLLSLLLLFALLAFMPVLAPELRAGAQSTAPEVTVTLDKNRVTVGDPISLTVTVRHAPDVRIVTTSLDDQLGVLEPLASDPPDEHPVGGELELKLHYRVAVYQTGNVPVPAFVVAYTNADGSPGQATAVSPPAITVQSIVPANANPTDIKGLKPQFSMSVPAAVSGALVAGGVAVVLALVLAALAGVVLLQRRRRREPPRVPSAADAAREELDRVVALNLFAKGELVEHYRLIGACIRRYITGRFGFPAVTLTTGELERQMEARGVDRWPARLVAGLLNECDAVIYARYVPAPARAEADNAMAYEIVETLDGTGPVAVANAV
jgi:hypothetical protein